MRVEKMNHLTRYSLMRIMPENDQLKSDFSLLLLGRQGIGGNTICLYVKVKKKSNSREK